MFFSDNAFLQLKQYTMNPKAMPRQQLLGHIDMDTREWADGVLTHSARNVVKEQHGRKENVLRILLSSISKTFNFKHLCVCRCELVDCV